MPIFDPCVDLRPIGEMPSGSRVFYDRGQAIPVTLHALDTLRLLAAGPKQGELVRDYTAPEGQAPRLTLAGSNGKRIPMTPEGCRIIALLMERQRELPEGDQYSLVVWAGILAGTVKAPFEMMAFGNELDALLETGAERPFGQAGTAPSSRPPFEDASTHPSPSGGTGCSAPSTNGLVPSAESSGQTMPEQIASPSG